MLLRDRHGVGRGVGRGTGLGASVVAPEVGAGVDIGGSVGKGVAGAGVDIGGSVGKGVVGTGTGGRVMIAVGGSDLSVPASTAANRRPRAKMEYFMLEGGLFR